MDDSATFSRFEEKWGKVEAEGIDKIKDSLEKNVGSNSKGRPRRLFSCHEIINMKHTVYDLCTNKHAEYGNSSAEVYRRYGEIYEKYLTSIVAPVFLYTNRGGLEGEDLLQEFVQRWMNHAVMTYWLEKFFLYLEQWYTKHAGVPKLRQVSVQRFKMFVYDEVKSRITKALLCVIEKDRRGEIVNNHLLKSAIEIYEIMGIDSLIAYHSDFENHLLQSSQEYFSRCHNNWMEKFDQSAYLSKAESAFQKEQHIISSYLNQSSKPKLLRVLREELLETVHGQFFGTNGLAICKMISQDQNMDLRRLFTLFSENRDCLDLMLTSYQRFVEEVGNNCIPHGVLSAFYDKCFIIAEDCFLGHNAFLNAVLVYYLDRT
eukprot:CAMPEP_0183309792 /NCGR_PEP_ID=MMETSP0160_2-20130417/25550_1 /TAXON_ID=2839 ORGANISM="Odontella Sinensis, Strain Grunow 1884" /NCGR_SAMPLE_ID=MMETSP0160_2 /ASSEMBLY_ACC=CAM_ASM_000250 /LENGTH=372 /DNA_ID=CAMNT_0025473869 /DNA_START=115 /DNA_END=1229 /DNA_ORIENTATION=+